MNLPKGPLQDWSYILLAKSRELLSLKVILENAYLKIIRPRF